ncbi:hypothetical protein TVAG_396810 [Trichomonas vaginalis G3]|uniref:CWH43-like N-terminal domain-containing protein n=1 Tax=Trichomonas vaginalis (strain ATCC PRA-98 / G3) TaxID=412133 RepID=A2DX69_TRIV3|nr:fasting-inducible integral membrane protein TM6p1-related family [Trichomonas vaginalis G3]EAY14951.1 hypothetical protein TVAG_396810 [Trichomonas vaginalis G3]KAI5507381.1 fasting-inducible integral membrane protein TM6p1-related family [Trichomonas vaginalis G3]|eukprot:XP_001327174.1 hypothetical protein [Trichomonas vaginalis G3]
MIAIAVSIYYTLKHNKVYKYTIVTISESVVFLPESRIFNISMTIMALLQSVVFILRHHYLNVIITRESKWYLHLLKWICIIFAFVSPPAFIGLANFTVREFFNVHNMCAFIYFYTVSFYFLCYDIIIICVKKKIKWYSMFVTILGIICLQLSLWPLFIDPHNNTIVSTTSVFEFITVFLFTLKTTLTLVDLPPHGIKFYSK